MKTLAMENKSLSWNWSIFTSFLLSCLFTLTGNIQLIIAIFPYIFMKSNIGKILFILPTFLIYIVSKVYCFQILIYISGYFLLTYFMRRIHGNTISVLKYYVAFSSLVISYMNTSDIKLSLSLFIIQMIFYHETMKSFEWLKKETLIPKSIYALIVMSLIFLAIQFIPMYQEILIIIGFIFICFGSNPLISILSLFYVNLFYPVLSYETFVYILLISLLKEQLGVMILVFLGLFVVQANNIYEILILGLYLMFFLLLSKEGIPVHEEIQISNSKAYLQKQLVNFSLIFDYLATYYENISKIEFDFLKSMSSALRYTANKKIQDELSSEVIKSQVISILEGYHIGYEEVIVECNEEGMIRIVCSLLNFAANEIKEVLLPLLNHILPTPMECLSMRSSWLELGVLNVEFISSPPYQVDAYADSIHVDKTCGDSFSIFQHSSNVYCLISDGMGSGKEASKISKCIIHLFQRMIFSNINEVEALNCINKLLLSDTYATCDILIFNRFKKSVMICKSAANPTYLIRNNELFAIWGSSLPIGIVAHIDVDTIHVQVEKGDIFVMSSDGVNIEEVIQWMKKRENLSSRKEVERFIELLKMNERSDDSTILLAKVN